MMRLSTCHLSGFGVVPLDPFQLKIGLEIIMVPGVLGWIGLNPLSKSNMYHIQY
jgi:hypothetical protein